MCICLWTEGSVQQIGTVAIDLAHPLLESLRGSDIERGIGQPLAGRWHSPICRQDHSLPTF